MRVLHVASGRLFGGVERSLVTLWQCREAARDIEPLFAVCARGRLIDELTVAGAAPVLLGNVRLSRPHTVWAARDGLRRLIETGSVDVLVCHAPWAYALFASVGRAAGIPLVFWQHDRADGRSAVERWAASVPADLVITNSEWTARSTRALQGAAPVRIVRCPVRVPLFADARPKLRVALGTGTDDVVILSASRLEPWKGHRTLIWALWTLPETMPWTLWIAGGAHRPHEVAYECELKATVERLAVAARVRFLGERRDVAQLMAAADIFCQTNEQPEPFGVVFAEALSCGLPVIAVGSGGVPEIVNERCGRLIAPDDPGALTRVLGELITDRGLRESLGAAGPGHARAVCGPDVVLPALDRALRSTMVAAVA
jgi:glycosyltransferase involved in cell wall biosynthesis